MPFVREVDNSAAEEELTRAVRKVYERYGNDLNAFFRDVQEQVARNGVATAIPSAPETLLNEQAER